MLIEKVSHIWGSTEINSRQKDPPRSLRLFILSSEIPRSQVTVRGEEDHLISALLLTWLPKHVPLASLRVWMCPAWLLLFACPVCSRKSKSKDKTTKGDVFFSVRTGRIIH